MKLNSQAKDALAALDKLTALAQPELQALRASIEASTFGRLSLCDTWSLDHLQLYHDATRCPVDEAIEIFRDLADDSNIARSWSQDNQVCFRGCIEGHPFSLVLTQR